MLFKNKLSKYSKAVLISCVVEALLILIFELIIAISIVPNVDLNNRSDPLRGLPVYLSIFIFGQLFQVYFAWDAIMNENTIQLFAWVAMNVASFSYSLFQLQDVSKVEATWNQFQGLFYTVCAILGIFCIIYGAFTYKCYCEFGWKVYKKIGADPRMKQMYRTFQIFLMLLKACFFVFISFSLQFMILVLQPNDPELYLTILALVLTVVILFLASDALYKEKKWGMVLFVFCTLLAIAYFLFKLIRMYEPDQAFKYENVRNYLTFFAVLSLLTVIGTGVNAVFCIRNFDKGLKSAIENASMSTLSRMTIEQ